MSDKDEEATETKAPREALRRAEGFFYVDDLEAPLLDLEDEHHALHVLRLTERSSVVVSDGKGSWRSCRLERFGEAKGSVRRRRVEVDEEHGRARLSSLSAVFSDEESNAKRLFVGFSLQKGDRPEWAVQKLTEIGVDVVIPFLSERTVVRLDGDGARRRGERLRRVAREAAAQSRRVRLPDVRDPRPLADALGDLNARKVIASFAEPGGAGLSKETQAVFVGPEGGWSNEELLLSSDHVGLGPTVLRAETAAIVAGTLLVALRSGLVMAGP